MKQKPKDKQIKKESWDEWLKKYKCEDEDWRMVIDTMQDIVIQKTRADTLKEIGLICAFRVHDNTWEEEDVCSYRHGFCDGIRWILDKVNELKPKEKENDE
jgi:hypothetical protein